MSRLSLIIVILLVSGFFSSRVAFAATSICQDNFPNLQTCVWNAVPASQDVFVRELPFYSSRVSPETPSGRYFLLTGNSYNSNYIFRFHIKGIFGLHKMAVFRFQDENNYYLLDLKSSLNNDDSWIYLYKIKSGQQELLQRARYVNQIDNWYFLELRAVDNRFLVSVFDQPLINYYDASPFWSGRMGFAADGEAKEKTEVWYNFIDILDTSEKNSVIFIPGLGASWSIPAMLSCNLQPQDGWTLAPYADLYQRLILTFEQNGYILNKDFFIYAYDWRQTMEQAGKDFKAYLDKLLPTISSGQLNIVSHSLGGLVIRSYLQQYGNGLIKKVITLGSPHQGTVLAYPMWEGGEIWTDNQMQKMAASYLVNHCRSPLQLSAKDVMHKIAPSLKDLLPTFNYLKNQGQNSFIETSTLKEQNTWLTNNSLPDNLFNTQFITIGGEDVNTLDYLEVSPPSGTDAVLGLWKDGKPANTHHIAQGDGTILESSALIPSAITETIKNTDHGGLVYSDEGLKTIFKYLGQTNVILAAYQSSPQITEIKITLPGQLQTIWKKYQLKIHY